MSNREFIWGETPTIFVGRVDHFMYAPVWFDKVENDPQRNTFELIGLSKEYRTNRLKKYRTWDMAYRKGFIDTNINSILGHMANVRDCELAILDGYPIPYLKLIKDRFNMVYEQIFGKDMDKAWLNRIHVVRAKSLQQYYNALTENEALANERGWAYVFLGDPSFVDCIPELSIYQKAITEYSNRPPVNTDNQLTQEEIDELLKGGNGGGKIQ